MAIQMVGGVYCPLSPRDPQQRLHALVQQTQSCLVLTHWLTKAKFSNDFILLDIDLPLINNNNNLKNNTDVNQLSTVSVTSDDIAYIIFTSGSTGTPKAVSYYINIELEL
jgi:non-ribosomal peptide synthetase component F